MTRLAADAGSAGVGSRPLSESDPSEVVMASAKPKPDFARWSGEGRNRTGDTTVFSRVLYRLSYLARAGKSSRGRPGLPDQDSGRNPLDSAPSERPGRCYRAANVRVGRTLPGTGLPGKEGRPPPYLELRKVRESATLELSAQSGRIDVDRRFAAAREAEDDVAAGSD